METLHVEHRGHLGISWGAVLAGVVVALSVGGVLNLLGLGLDLRQFHFERNTIANMSFFSMLWLILTSVLSILAGSWIAGRLSCRGCPQEGALHGLVMWAVTTLLTFSFIATSVGAAVGVMSNLIGHGMHLSVQPAQMNQVPANTPSQGMTPAEQAQAQQDTEAMKAGVEKTSHNLGNIVFITFFTFLITAITSVLGGRWGARWGYERKQVV